MRPAKFIVFDDDGPDSLGRRQFTLVRRDTTGVYRPELSNYDGKPVGYRRGQRYFMRPDLFLDTYTETTEEDANARIAELEEAG